MTSLARARGDGRLSCRQVLEPRPEVPVCCRKDVGDLSAAECSSTLDPMVHKPDTAALLVGVATVAGPDVAKQVVQLAREMAPRLEAELVAVRAIGEAGDEVMRDLEGRSLSPAVTRAEPETLLANLVAATLGEDVRARSGAATVSMPAAEPAATKRGSRHAASPDVPEVLARQLPRNDDFAEKRVYARARNGQVLGAITEGIQRPPHIAQAIDMHRATVLDAIRKLLSEGLVDKLGERDGFYGPTATGRQAYLELLAEAKLDDPELLRRFGLSTSGGDV